MKKHIKTYLEYYWVEQDQIKCENPKCKNMAVDIHHIKPRSWFWKKIKYLQDLIENLIALCRDCHDRAHFKKEKYLRKEELQKIHNQNLWKD